MIDNIKFTKTNDAAELLAPAVLGDLGYDMRSCVKTTIRPGTMSVIDLGLKVDLPSGYGCTFIARSSLAMKGMLVLPGLIDNGYRGPLYLFCTSIDRNIPVNIGDRIAQLVLMAQPTINVGVLEVKSLTESERGDNGFGSTGSK